MFSSLCLVSALAATSLISINAQNVLPGRDLPDTAITRYSSTPFPLVTTLSSATLIPREDPRRFGHPSEDISRNNDSNQRNNDPNQKVNEPVGNKAEPGPPSPTPAAMTTPPPNCDASVAAASTQAQASASSAVEIAMQSASEGILSANSSAAAVATAVSASEASAVASLSADASRLISSAQAAASAVANDASKAIQQASLAIAAATGSVGVAASSLLVAASQVTPQACPSANPIPAIADTQSSSASETISTLQREVRGSWSARQAATGIVLSAIISSIVTIAIYCFMARYIAKRNHDPKSNGHTAREEDDYPSELKRKTYHPPKAVLDGRRLDSLTSIDNDSSQGKGLSITELQLSPTKTISPLRRNTYIAPVLASTTPADIKPVPNVPQMAHTTATPNPEVDAPNLKFNFFGTAS